MKPGLGTPPVNVIVPLEFENVGFCTHKEKIDWLSLTDITCSKPGGNCIVAAEVLMASPLLFTRTLTSITLPTATCAELGVIASVAA